MEFHDEIPRTTILGFVVAFGILFALLYLVGIDDVVAAISVADPGSLIAIAAMVVAWIGVWSGSFYITSRVFDSGASYGESIAIYVHMMFLDNVIPFSSISADPIAAVAVSRRTGSEYETSLATVITVDFLNFLPAPVFGTLGLVYLLIVLPFDESIARLAVSVVGLLIGLSIVGYLSWVNRHRVVNAGSRAVAALFGKLDGVFPRTAFPPEAEVEDRAHSLVDHLETMAADRPSVLAVSVLAVAGWSLLGATLWLSIYSVGYSISIGLALFLVPLVNVGEMVPLPGGIGASESLFVLLLVALSDVTPAVATAGILVHRGATYWIPVILGGGVIPLVLGE